MLPQPLFNYSDLYKKWSTKYQECMSKKSDMFGSQKAFAISGLRAAVNTKMTGVINNWVTSMNANRQGLLGFGISDGVGLAFGMKSGAAAMGRGFVQTRAAVFGAQTAQSYFNLFMGQTSLADWEAQTSRPSLHQNDSLEISNGRFLVESPRFDRTMGVRLHPVRSMEPSRRLAKRSECSPC